MLESFVMSYNAKYMCYFENQGRGHSIEKVYMTLEVVKTLMNKQFLLSGKLYLLSMKIT